MANVNDKEALLDVLMQEKDIMKVYGSFIPEGSTEQLRTILQDNLDVVTKQQFQVFDKMNKKGYYPLKEAKAQAINDVKNTFAQA